MPVISALHSLQDLTDVIANDIQNVEKKWKTKYAKQKDSYKSLKRKYKHSNTLVYSYKKENERLWELIFTRLNHSSTVEKPKEVYDLIDSIPCVTPPEKKTKYAKKECKLPAKDDSATATTVGIPKFC